MKDGVLAAKGFFAAATSCGLKTRKGALDLGLIVSDRRATPAAVFTTNKMAAAPVQVSRRHARRGPVHAIVVNSGNANACTGAEGLRDAERMAALSARCLCVKPSEVLVASTGRIGVPLPMGNVSAGIERAASELARGGRAADRVARAIMTTDTFAKSCAMSVRARGGSIRVGGTAKGAGMIAPNMATMHCFITTDAAVSAPLLRRALREAVRDSFNAITVDSDMSTNDTLVVLANGAAAAEPIRTNGKTYAAFAGALRDVARELAVMLVRDGEGATKLVEVNVQGARSEKEAKIVARAVADSPLVKTAVHGADPNWGRVAAAVGYANASVVPEKTRIALQGTVTFDGGVPQPYCERKLAAAMRRRQIRIDISLRLGKAAARVWTCDLSKEYVTINADYHT